MTGRFLPILAALTVSLALWAVLHPILLDHLDLSDRVKGLIEVAVAIGGFTLTRNFVQRRVATGC